MTMDDLEQQDILLRRQRAAALRGAPMPEGRMVGRVYVAPSWTQYLATGLKQYAGAKDEQAADADLKALGTKRQEAMTNALRGFSERMQDRPAYEVGANEMDSQGYTAPARPADPMGAYGQLVQSGLPDLQRMGMQGIGQQAQFKAQQDALAAAEARKAAAALAERQRIADILEQTKGNPQAALAAGVPADAVKAFYESPNYGRQKVTWQDVGGQKVPMTEYGDTPQGVAPLQKTPGPANPYSDLVIPGPNGTVVPNLPVINAKTGIARAGATNVDVKNFNTQESEQSKVFGKAQGEVAANIQQAGFDAPGKLARLTRMEELLKGIDGGGAAPAMADIASVAQSFGIKLDPRLGNKQAAEALAREMAGSLRQPGTGPMTDKDFENFLKQVPSLSKTAEGRAEIIKTMRAAVDRDLRAAKYAREYRKANKGVIDDNFFDSLAEWYAANPVVTPKLPATNARGGQFKIIGVE